MRSAFGVFILAGFVLGSSSVKASITNLDDALVETRNAVEASFQELERLKALKGSLFTDADVVPMTVCGRLTLQSNVAVPNTDQIGISTIYFTPYQGSNITLYNGTIWQTYTFTQISLALTGLTNAKNYDVFIYNNAGTLTLVLGTAWTSNTARATALTLVNGVYVNSANNNQLYLGTIRTTATTTTEDSVKHRYVWNYFNRRRRVMSVGSATANWTYTTAAWRAADASTTLELQYVMGINEELVEAIVLIPTYSTGSTNAAYSVGIGVDSTTVNSAQVAAAYGSSTDGNGTTNAEYRGYPGIGYHYLQWIEYGGNGVNFLATEYGFLGGIFGYLEA